MVRLLLILGIPSLVIPFLAGCDRKEAQAANTAPPPAAVTVAVAQTKDVPVYLEEIGKTTACEFVTIQAQVSGVIKQIHFTDGQDVKKGDMLFTIDPRPYEAALAQSKAMLSMNSASLSLAKQEWDRVQGLQTNNAISKEEFEQRQNAVSVDEAQVEAAAANIAAAQVNLDYCYIKSPIDGRAGQRLVDVGNVVTPSSNQPMLTITKLDPIYADFTINEGNLDEVRAHMADHTLKTQVWTPDDALRHAEPREGDLTFLNNTVQDNSGTIKLRATLPNADHHFWPGQFVNVRLILQVKKDAVLVPSAAQQVGQQGPYVYVIKEVPAPDGGKPMTTAEMRPIVQGQRFGDQIVVDKGVSPGETVIVTGQLMVMPGAPVAIVPNAPAPGGAPPASGPATKPATTSMNSGNAK